MLELTTHVTMYVISKQGFQTGPSFLTYDPGVHSYGFNKCIAFQCRPLLDPFHV